MKIARVAGADGPRYAVVTPRGLELIHDPFAKEPTRTGEILPSDTQLLSPVDPRIVIGIAHNKALRDHVLPIQAWLKSPRTVVGPGAPVRARRDVGQVNVEGELAVVMARSTRALTLDSALEAVLGFTVANDVTNVDRAAIDERNFEAKAGVGYTPLGPWIQTELDTPDAAKITVRVDGEVRAESSTALLQSTVAECLVYVSSWLALGPGDVVMTGAPATFVSVAACQEVEIELSGVGTLKNPIV